MFNIRNTGMTDKPGFRYTCYVATTTKHLKTFRKSSLWTCSHSMMIFLLCCPDCVALNFLKRYLAGGHKRMHRRPQEHIL